MMTNKPKNLSDTARAVLILAATRDDHLVRLPHLPVAAAREVVRSMLTAGLVEEVPEPLDDADYAWRTGADGRMLMLRATALGLSRVAAGVGATMSLVSIRSAGNTAPEVRGQIGLSSNGLPTMVTLFRADAPGSTVQRDPSVDEQLSGVERTKSASTALQPTKAVDELVTAGHQPNAARTSARSPRPGWTHGRNCAAAPSLAL
jgi:hypothetical protein